jgi:DNA-directed RNA polymerase subunit L
MEIQIINEDKTFIEFKIIGEGHTLCNALRAELADVSDVSFASYNIKHPMSGASVFALKVKKGSPRKALQDGIDSLKAKNNTIRTALKSFSV